MIRLNNINVKFDKSIFENANIEISNGKVTVITGESGVGKTTLLYILGLISEENDLKYYWDEEEIELVNDKKCSEIRKRKIGYIFQDNNLNEKLSLKGNIELSARIAGLKISNEEIDELLKYVNLDYNLNEYPSKLSGGEKQRLAIACALAKDPDLVIADEPTSALDMKNSKIIIDILKKYAHMKNKKVVIVTHNPFVVGEADVQYAIENNEIVILREDSKSNESNDDGCDDKKTRKNSFLSYYAINSTRKDALKKSIFLFFLSVAIALTVLSINFGEQYKAELNRNVNNISNNTVLVINQSAPLSDKKILMIICQ